MTILYETSLPYLPKGNKATYSRVENIDENNVTCSFVIGFYNGMLVLANNLKRGIEIPGGHLENSEMAVEAAIREFREETGCSLLHIEPFIRLDMVCNGIKPKNYKYPYPKSAMEFFYGEIDEIGFDFMDNEVSYPYFINIKDLTNNPENFVEKYSTNETFKLMIDNAISYYNNRNEII